MALSLSVYNPEQQAQFAKHDMNRTYVGSAINHMRAFVTSLENERGMTETSSVMRFFTTALTLGLGIFVTPMELTGRASIGFVEGLIYCVLKEGNRSGADFFKQQAITEAKAIITAAKVWVFFSNPILDVAYVVYNLLPNSYQTNTEADQFFESKLSDPNRLAKRNFICAQLDTLGKNPDDNAVKQVSKRIFLGLLSYAIASVDSAARVATNVVLLPMTKVTQFAGRGSLSAYNTAASGAVHAFNLITGKQKVAHQADIEAFSSRMDDHMMAQAKRVVEHGINIGVLYNPVAIAIEVLEHAAAPMLLGAEAQ